MKKIMFIHHSGSIGGAGVSCYNTSVSLMKHYNVVVYVPNEPSDFRDFLESKDIPVRTYSIPLGSIPYYSGGTPVMSPVFFRSVWNIKKHMQEWEQLIKAESPDVVIVNSKTTSWLAVVTSKLNIKSVCFVRETRKKSLLSFWSSVQKYFLDMFSAVIFISDYDKEKEHLRKTISSVVPNYIDIQQYSQYKDKKELAKSYGIPPDKFNILFVGGVARIKGIDVAIKALKYLRDYDVGLIIVGDAEFHYRSGSDIYTRVYNFLKRDYENKILKVIEEYDLGEMIYKLGIQRSMRDMYSLADVLIFPANEPHQARPAFEAGASRVPVILPDFDNTKEYVKHRVNGLVFRRRDPKSLSKQIIEMIKDPRLREKLGEENYRHTVSIHTKEVSESKLLDTINLVLGE